jgi:oxepin-CoA hydrolase/3-oxo-5,6-dehydrosuberyl-CoA semialdehyde dehydrogenase
MLKQVQHDGNRDMKTLKLLNYAQDRWYGADSGLAPVESAVTGEVVAETGSGGLDFKARR